MNTDAFDTKSASKSGRNLPFGGPGGGPGEVPGGPGGGPGWVPGGSRRDLEGSWGTFGGLGNAPGDLEAAPKRLQNLAHILTSSWTLLGPVLGPYLAFKTAPRWPPKGSRNELRRGGAKSLKSTTVTHFEHFRALNLDPKMAPRRVEKGFEKSL